MASVWHHLFVAGNHKSFDMMMIVMIMMMMLMAWIMMMTVDTRVILMSYDFISNKSK